MRILFLHLIAILCIYSNCNKNPFGCIGDNYQFALEMKVFPDNENVHIGDTIWLESSLKKIFTDIVSGKQLEFSNAANLGVDLNICQIIEDSNHVKKIVPAVKSFQFLLIKGRFLPDDLSPERNIDYDFTETDTTYEFKLGIIPKHSGVFWFGPSHSGGVYRKHAMCPRVGFMVTLTNTQQHMHIFADAIKPNEVSAFEQRQIYSFNVIK